MLSVDLHLRKHNEKNALSKIEMTEKNPQSYKNS